MEEQKLTELGVSHFQHSQKQVEQLLTRQLLVQHLQQILFMVFGQMVTITTSLVLVT